MNSVTNKDRDKFIGTRKAADLLGVSQRTIQLWVEKGTLKAWKTAGGHRRITRSSLDKILQQKQDCLNQNPTIEPLTISIIEDQDDLLEYYRTCIELLDLPLQVDTINNSIDGIIKISHTQPDIIITDLNMPQMDGFQMLNALQKNKKLDNTDVIVVTGLSQEQVKQQGSLPENTRVIYKPFEFNTLASLIRKKVNKNTGKLHSSKHLTTA